MQIAARNAFTTGGGAPLPYDAEVEYLESTGTQWIDTGYVLRSGDSISCSFEILSNSSIGVLLGSRQSANSMNISSGIGNSFELICDYNNSSYSSYRATTSTRAPVGRYTVVLSPTVRSIEGVLDVSNATVNADDFTTNGNCLIFYGSGSFWTTNKFVGKMYSFRMSHNGSLVRDFIPVRVGSEGAMYDRVSGQLFRNQGTGAFVIGPDK